MATIARDKSLDNAESIAFHVYFTSNQELVRVDRKTLEATAKRHGGTRLVSYDEVKGTADAVRKGERAVEVAAYVAKSFRSDDPISGETVVSVRKSPSSLKLFVR